MTLVTVTGAADVAALTARWRAEGLRVGFVPTMGALHAGHAALVERAGADCDRVLASVFVNPTQFGPGEDFARYPRTLEADLNLLERAGADAAFTPDAKEVYPDGFATTVRIGPLGEVLCGAVRPGHFDGVATVVARLLGLVRPDAAYFGQKDYQQWLVIRRVVRDLGVPVEIVRCPTVREPDGLAMSSRNAYLEPADRARARAVPGALRDGAARFHAGARDARTVLAAMEEVLQAAMDEVDYVAACDPDTLAPVARLAEGTVLLVAARVGRARLIDNVILPDTVPDATGLQPP